MMKTSPAVFAAGHEYQIMVPVAGQSLFWVEINGESFFDEQNGIMRSACSTHRVKVPMSVLDTAKEYTVCEREVIARKTCILETKDTVRTSFKFSPVPQKDARVYHLADTHNMIEQPIKAADLFGKIDLLIMNGDIYDCDGDNSNYDIIYKLAEALTHGEIPIVFARGNHDLQGCLAECAAEHTPGLNGNTYFSFKLGNIWGLVLDCGEDEHISHSDYIQAESFHNFRLRQTEFIREIIKNRDAEYNADGVEHIIVVCHYPFTYVHKPVFGIEREIYKEWIRLIKDNIKPELMLCGHIHRLVVSEIGGELDTFGQPCTVISGSDKKKSYYHAGCGIVFSSPLQGTFYDSEGMVKNFKL